MILLIVLLYLMKETVETSKATNFAWKTSILICNSKNASKEIYDNNLYQVAETLGSTCQDAHIKLYFGFSYAVHYAVIFGGESIQENKIHWGGNFHIYKSPEDCGEYFKRNRAVFQGMRVNCESVYKLCASMDIKINTLPFYLAEIQLYTFASGGGIINIYKGCFSDFTANGIKKKLFGMCAVYCEKEGFVYYAFKEKKCYCRSNLDGVTARAVEHCNIQCTVLRDNKCEGNDNMHSVYINTVQLPYCKGCSDGTHAIAEESDDMTIAKCLKLCDYSYFSLTKNGKHCACTNDSSTFSFVNAELCNTPCSGDPNNYCGGTNYWSVYGTCLSNNLKEALPCSKLFHCARSWDEYGVCVGGCEDGYVGEHCIEKGQKSELQEISECIDDPCINQPNSVCVFNTVTGNSCSCIKGYWNIRDSEKCEDINECEYDSCDKRTTFCKNKLGSYICICKPGHLKLTAYVCQEEISSSRRCASYLNCRNKPNSVCYYNKNTNSYRCVCRYGYWENDDDTCHDIDECKYELCDNISSTCENTSGDYRCLCRGNYHQVDEYQCVENRTIYDVDHLQNYLQYYPSQLLLAVILLAFIWLVNFLLHFVIA